MDLEEEIDLRAYIAILLKYKYWIVGLAFLFALVAFVISSLLPLTFEAKALVAILKPRYTMQFDPRFETSNDVLPPYKAYSSLALGDQVVGALIGDLGSELDTEEQDVTRFRGKLEVASDGDLSVVQLIVRDSDPRRAATIVNRWASIFVDQVNDLYGRYEQELTFFEHQLTQAESELAVAEQARIEFEARNQAAILGAQLGNKRAALNDYLSAARSLGLIIQDARSLQDRLRSQDAATDASLSDELTSLFLEVEALNRGTLPIQLQISGQQGLSSKTVGEQVALLDSLIQVLENKRTILGGEAETLEPDILVLQEQLERVNTQQDRLTMARDVARDTFLSLSRKVAEARIAAQNTEGDVRLASQASVPSEPVAPRRLLNTAIAGALGLLVAILGAFAVEYWRQGQPASVTKEPALESSLSTSQQRT